MESRLFQDALKSAESDFGAPARKVCLSCHSPIAVQTGDLGLVRKVSWEGVTCDYCHSIRDVTWNGANPKATVEFSLVKSGPWKGVESSAHATAFSAVHTSSLACVSCHEYRNAQGFPVLTTYTEWNESSYGQEKGGCQSCHMARVQGDVVDPRVKRAAEPMINLHQIPGSHSLEQLNKAVRAQISANHEGGTLKVFVEVQNRGAGHSVPTGSPLRQLILELRADSFDGRHYRQERTYRRAVADASGKPVDREDLAFVKGARVLSDTRLTANETRREAFTFQVPPGTQTQLEANFYYYYSPTATTEAQQKLKFLSLRRLVP